MASGLKIIVELKEVLFVTVSEKAIIAVKVISDGTIHV